MRLYKQLILFVLAATTIPLIVGFTILYQNEKQLKERLLDSREESAVGLAEVVLREMKQVFVRLQDVLGYVSLEKMSPDEMTGLLGILYKQSEEIVQVALLNEQGAEVVPGVYLDHPERYPEYAGRRGVSAEDHARFLAGLPLEKALGAPPGSIVLGEAQRLPGSELLAVSIAIPVVLPKDKGRWIAAVEMSLERIVCRIIETGDTRGWSAMLVDSHGKVIAHADKNLMVERKDMSSNPAVARLASGKRGAFLVQEALAAYARIPMLDWGVVVTQSRTEALAGVRRARRVTVVWTAVSILALLVLGGLFTGRITRNLRRLVKGVEEFTRGNLSARVEISSRDEVGKLANNFNRMGEELKASREEIEEWNRELTRRVEERTRELELTHRRLLETSKLAAIGQLGAGVAHEINNPLVGILGNIQLMLKKHEGDDKDRQVLEKVERAAKRCREVTQNLLRFSEQVEDPEHVEVDLNQVLKDAYSLTEQQMEAHDITTSWDLTPGLKVEGDHRQLMRVFLNLYTNARTAMQEKGGQLTIRSSAVEDGLLKVEVGDTGKGIEPERRERIFEPFFTTKDVWTNTGLGLSVAFRVISDHGGQIELDSKPGEGTTFEVTLPAMGDMA